MRLDSSTVAASLDAIRAELSRTKLSASTLNFIVWIDDVNRRDWILERAAKLGRKHPSFMLVLDNTGADGGSATVTSGPRETESHFTVQGEQVIIDASRFDADELVEYVTTLCPSGVPTLLWWSGMREGSRPAFEALLPLSDTLLVDSSGAVRDEATLRVVADFHRARPGVVLRDLAWMRLSPWQDMIANFFDNPALLNELYTIRKLFITSGSAAEAMYLGGWLASRLGWTASGRDAFTDARGKEISFARRIDGEIRRVHSICLDSETSWYHGEVTEDPTVVSIWVEGEHARDVRLFPLPLIDTASLIERAILEQGPDEVFETTLCTVSTLLG